LILLEKDELTTEATEEHRRNQNPHPVAKYGGKDGAPSVSN
jgi:hypothetical protein